MRHGRFLTRRDMLLRCANGFGAVALAALLAEEGHGGEAKPAGAARCGTTRRRPRNVIFLYMDGGPSQVDTFDYKPLLEKYHGKDPHSVFKVEPTQFNNVGRVMASPWKFQQHGQSGALGQRPVPARRRAASTTWPSSGRWCRSSPSTPAPTISCTPARGVQGRPSMGAWVSYGLGSENQQPARLHRPQRRPDPARRPRQLQQRLPAGRLPGLGLPRRRPARRQHRPPRGRPTSCSAASSTCCAGSTRLGARPPRPARRDRVGHRQLRDGLPHADGRARADGRQGRDARRRGGCTASTPSTRRRGSSARQCLIARRLVERGARFIELTCPNVGGDRWDQHGKLASGHENNARAVDQPIAGAAEGPEGARAARRRRWWSGPASSAGRRSPRGATAATTTRSASPSGWPAAASRAASSTARPTSGATRRSQGKVEIHDLHATMLHLLGVDHKRLTFRFGGRDMRLTDVHGEVIREVIA